MNPTPPQRPPAVHELAEALRLTREYVGESLLPPVDGWSWYDALRRWAPEYLPSGSAVAPVCADPHPALTAKLSYAPQEDRLRDAEIRAAVAEHEAEAYRNQVRALVREILRMREVPEEELPTRVSVIIVDEETL